MKNRIDNLKVDAKKITIIAISLYALTLFYMFTHAEEYSREQLNMVLTTGLYGIIGIIAATYIWQFIYRSIANVISDRSKAQHIHTATQRRRIKANNALKDNIALIIVGLFSFCWAGFSIYLGTPEIQDYYFRKTSIHLTIDSNPIGFWVITSLIISFGLLFFIMGVAGFLHRDEDVLNAISNKPISFTYQRNKFSDRKLNDTKSSDHQP